MKGIILAGGSGSRLHPLTLVVSKQMMPIYDKPMIYYPLSTLLYSGIRDILIISTPHDLPLFDKPMIYYPLSVLMMARIRDFMLISTPRDIELFKILLGDGSELGINIEYAVQDKPDGIASAFKIAKDFVGKESVALILGDNIFQMKINTLSECSNVDGGIIFGYHVNDPERYGVVEFDKDYKVLSIEEKPSYPKSNYAVPGLYYYDNSVVDIAKRVKPSVRQEYEITDVNKEFLNQGKLDVKLLGRGTTWLDTGTFDSLQEAGSFVKTLENSQGLKIGYPEEVAWRNDWITDKELNKLSINLAKSGYGDYLKSLIKEKELL